MIPISLKALANITRGHIYGKDVIIDAITTDSRKAYSGTLFACIKGQRVDGHDFALQAEATGAAAVLCERMPDNISIPAIVVPSTLKALQDIAREILKNAGIPVVAIGGSVGKTSTKELIASVVSQKYNILKTEGNFNNDLGLPLTIFNLEKEHEAAVLELGISDFGEMHLLSSIARPDICVLTNIGDCHLEFLKDRDGVLKAKSEMFDFMKSDGCIILNGDDEKLKTVGTIKGVSPEFYGFGANNDVRAESIINMGHLGSRFTVASKYGKFDACIKMPGTHMILNALAAVCVGIKLNLSFDEIAKGIKEYTSIDGRFKVNVTDKFTVIDDCYNANPMSMKASLEALSEIPGRKIAVLGDMGELGAKEREYHYEIGKFAADLKLDAICCIGKLSKEMYKGVAGFKADDIVDEEVINKKLNLFYFETVDDFLKNKNKIIKKGDTILIKASHFMSFKEIADALINS